MKKNIFRKVLQSTLNVIARGLIWRFKPKVVAITGSAGKTSTKEAVYAVLKEQFRVRRSVGNFNTEIGLPLCIISDFNEDDLKVISRKSKAGQKFRKAIFFIKTIFIGLFRLIFAKKNNYPEILILEYGVDRPGDMKRLLGIAKPSIAVITTIGEIPPHVEFFSSPEQLAREKSRLVESLPVSAFAILNEDNEITREMKNRTRASQLTFGFSNKADLEIKTFANKMAGDFEKPELWGLSFKIKYGGSVVPIIIHGALGRGQAYAAAAAAAVGLTCGLNMVEIAERLKDYVPPEGRLKIVKGVKSTIILDDAYNASPISVSEALEVLRGLPSKRKVAVLGDMLELGEYAVEAHEKIGKVVASAADVLVAVGERAKFLASSAEKNGLKGRVFWFGNVEEAGRKTQELLKPGDAVLVKASYAMGFQKIVDEIRFIG